MRLILFLAMRILHVLAAAVWLGATIFLARFLMPAVQEAGPAGAQVMTGLARRGLVTFMALLGGTTLLTGVWLYWRFTGGFDPGVSAARPGMVFGIGGVAGILAAAIQGATARRPIAAAANQIILVLLPMATALMVIGHYV